MYSILKADSSNAGDYLIFASCKKLVRQIVPETKFLEFTHQQDLGNFLEKLNSTKALLIPHLGIRNQMWPQVYRLTDDLSKIKIPIIAIGTGAKEMSPILIDNHKSKDQFDIKKTNVKFSESVNELFSNIHQPISVRDIYTKTVLDNNGFTNNVLTGDPAWYDFENMDKEFKIPETVNKISFTTPHAPWMMEQAKSILDVLTSIWPNSEIFCCLHSGTNMEDQIVSDYAKQLGCTEKVLRTTDDFEFYKTSDIHIGYRLHSHIFHLRNNIPSWLIYEDARGWAFDRSFSNKIGFQGIELPQNKLIHYMKNRGRLRNFAVKQNLRNEIKSIFTSENMFAQYKSLNGFFSQAWTEKMKPYLESVLTK